MRKAVWHQFSSSLGTTKSQASSCWLGSACPSPSWIGLLAAPLSWGCHFLRFCQFSTLNTTKIIFYNTLCLPEIVLSLYLKFSNISLACIFLSGGVISHCFHSSASQWMPQGQSEPLWISISFFLEEQPKVHNPGRLGTAPATYKVQTIEICPLEPSTLCAHLSLGHQGQPWPVFSFPFSPHWLSNLHLPTARSDYVSFKWSYIQFDSLIENTHTQQKKHDV